MRPDDLRAQLRRAHALHAPDDDALRVLADRVRTAAAAAPPATRARAVRRLRMGLVAATLVVAIAALAIRQHARSSSRRDPGLAAAGDPRLPASLRGWMRVVDAQPRQVGGTTATQMDLVDTGGAAHCLIELPLAASSTPPALVEMTLPDTTVRTWLEDGHLFGLASPRRSATANSSARRPPAHAPQDEEPPMIGQPSASRLARLALVAVTTASLPAPASPAPSSAVDAPVGVQRAPVPAPPLVIAVNFHADWCHLCAKTTAEFQDLEHRFDDRSVLFVQMDLTSPATARQSAYLAAGLGLDEVWQANGRTAGFILLIDARTKDVVSRLSANLTADEAASEMGRVLASLE